MLLCIPHSMCNVSLLSSTCQIIAIKFSVLSFAIHSFISHSLEALDIVEIVLKIAIRWKLDDWVVSAGGRLSRWREFDSRRSYIFFSFWINFLLKNWNDGNTWPWKSQKAGHPDRLLQLQQQQQPQWNTTFTGDDQPDQRVHSQFGNEMKVGLQRYLTHLSGSQTSNWIWPFSWAHRLCWSSHSLSLNSVTNSAKTFQSRMDLPLLPLP